MDDDLDIVDYVKRLGYSQQQRKPKRIEQRSSVVNFLASLKISPQKIDKVDKVVQKQSTQQDLDLFLDKQIQSDVNLYPKRFLKRNNSMCNYNHSKVNISTKPIKIVELKPQETIDEAQEGLTVVNHYYRKLKQKERIRKRFIQSIKECKKEILRQSASLTLEPLQTKIKGEKIHRIGDKAAPKPQRYDNQGFLPCYLRISKQKTESTELKAQKSTIEYPVEFPAEVISKLKLPMVRRKTYQMN